MGISMYPLCRHQGEPGGQLTWLRHTPATAGAVIGHPGSVYAALIGR